MKSFISRNIFTGQVRQSIPFLTNELVASKCTQAQSGHSIHSARSLKQRSSLMEQLCRILDQHKKRTTELLSIETGSPVSFAEGQVQSAIATCRYHLKHTSLLAPSMLKTTAKKTLIKYWSLGTVYIVAKDFLDVIQAFVPNFLLGNCCLVRMAETTPGVAKLTEKLIHKAGIECGEYQNLFSTHQQTEQIIMESAALVFRGRQHSACGIAEIAGRHLKISSIITHSNNIVIVCKEADLNAVIEGLKHTIATGGQSLYSVRKIIIVEDIYQSFVERIKEYVGKLQFSDQMLETSLIGLSRGVGSVCKKGIIAQKIKDPFRGIQIVNGYEYDEKVEIGPVIKLYKVKNNNEAVKLCAETPNLLACSVYTQDQKQDLLERIYCRVGLVNVAPKYVPTPIEWKTFANVRTHYVAR